MRPIRAISDFGMRAVTDPDVDRVGRRLDDGRNDLRAMPKCSGYHSTGKGRAGAGAVEAWLPAGRERNGA